MTELPIHEVYAIRYATQPERPEGSTFLGGDPSKMIRGLDFFTYVIKGPNGIFVVDVKEYGNWKIRHYNEFYDALDDVYKKKTDYEQMEDGSFTKEREYYVHEDDYDEDGDFGKSKTPVLEIPI